MTAQPNIRRPERAAGGTPPGTGNGRVWTPGGMTERAATPHGVRAALTADDAAKAWFFLPRQKSTALGEAARMLEIDALAVEDLIGEREPVKLDWVGSAMIAVIRAVTFDAAAGDLATVQVSIVAGPRAMIVLADEAVQVELRRSLDRAEPEIVSDGIPAAIHAVVDHVVDGYSAALAEMEEAVDELSEALFDDRPLKRDQQLDAFRLRRALAHLRRSTTPMRNVASSLANAAGLAAPRRAASDPTPTDAIEALLGTRSVRRFSDVSDHADHAAQAADGLRDVISSMYETNLALADVHLNTVMKKLTGWAAIIAVPTLITGFMGMNVPYPGFQSEIGFLIAFVVMIAAVTTLFVTLRRKDWI